MHILRHKRSLSQFGRWKRSNSKVIICFLFLGTLYLFTSIRVATRHHRHEEQVVVVDSEPPPQRMIQAGSESQLLEFLVSLARLPTAQLRTALTGTDDVFQLSSLEQKGSCPFSPNTVERVAWLPARTSEQSSNRFRTRNDNDTNDDPPVVVVWYEHLSKAGGTSFCKLAKHNMAPEEVPRYYCMPSDGKLRDARVGIWSNAKLSKYISKSPHRIMANEWTPFPSERLDIDDENFSLLFVTTLREPLNRLMSAYRFFNSRKGKELPTMTKWILNRQRISRRTPSHTMTTGSHVSRYNFITWKFSNGTMPLAPDFDKEREEGLPPLGLSYTDDEALWRNPFEMAIRNLSRFHLVLPLELMSLHSKPLRSVLGWNNLKEMHVVSEGKVVNSNTDSLSKEEYDILWEANRFDTILYTWTKAVYLTRIHCSHLL